MSFPEISFYFFATVLVLSALGVDARCGVSCNYAGAGVRGGSNGPIPICGNDVGY